MPITHATAADGTFSASGTTNWNADHTIADDTITAAMMAASSVDLATNTVTGVLPTANGGTGIAFFTAAGPTVARVYTFPDQAATILYSGGALGTPSSGTLTNATGLPEGGLSLTDITTANASASAHGFVPKWPNNTTTFFRGDGTYAAPTAAVTLDGITAATADQSGIANADWNVRWNWAKTTNSEVAFEIGESTASTGGTGVAQVILRASTLAGSTAVPFQVATRGTNVFSISATTQQIFAANGTVAAPIYSFAGATTTGLRFNGVGGAFLDTIIAGDRTAVLSALAMLYSKGTADAVSFAIDARKARGTVASPTVITTGDDLLTISGYGYVGATNTYQEAARITFDSAGTISDSTTGIAGIIRFLTAATAAEPAERWQIGMGGWLVGTELTTDPATTDLIAANGGVAIYTKSNKIVFAYDNAGTVTYASLALDGSSTAWVHNTTAP